MIADFTLVELCIRAARVVAIITGLLVVIDAAGILLSAKERPAHRPSWSATSWLLIGLTVAFAGSYLVSHDSGLVNVTDPVSQQLAVLSLWIGMAAGFTIRAASRAHRPHLVLISAIGMSLAGVSFALGTYV